MEATEGVPPDGKEIAVKRLFYNNKHKVANFHNEVDIISSVGHKNPVRLLGDAAFQDLKAFLSRNSCLTRALIASSLVINKSMNENFDSANMAYY
ncbi:putative cysteine-rich receptor-like protein kinase 43 [Mangifera indica]|uniref:putative cysteine-rich receptor-like protein kinase 43 n=1 Tax=Mangifera indica TaxID=29780 RepID=UPI001CFA3D84|nr:putative cysteine-rich receptor-like protein kinase 43 [Mangifera indica]